MDNHIDLVIWIKAIALVSINVVLSVCHHLFINSDILQNMESISFLADILLPIIQVIVGIITATWFSLNIFKNFIKPLFKKKKP